MRPFIRLSALLPVLLLFGPRAHAQLDPGTKWTASDAHVSQAFGSAVSIAGTVVAVGAPGDDPQFTTSDYGAVFVYRSDGTEWIEQQKLMKTQRENLDRFGQSVALAAVDITDGTSNTLLVGMQNDESVETGAGAVYVYQHDGSEWIQVATLTASDGAQGDGFSYSLGADYPDTVWFIVGAPRHSLQPFFQEGAAYIFRSEGGDWVEAGKLTASDADVSARFGEAVAISGDRALIGAPGDRAGGVGQNAGAVYVFEYDGSAWVEKAKLTASDAEGQAAFGFSVALDGDRALVGARLDGSSGAAYIFRLDEDEWIEEQKLTGSDAEGQALFGSDVALDGTEALVGAEHWFPENGDATGKAYLFMYDENLGQWLEMEDGLVPDDGGGGDNFGTAVALQDGVILVGASEHGLPEGGNGAVYAYGRAPATYSEEGAHTAAFSGFLFQNYPNPFREHTTIAYETAQPGPVLITIHDLLGRRVHTLVDAVQPAGRHEVRWNGRDPGGRPLVTGTYFYRLDAGGVHSSRQALYIR